MRWNESEAYQIARRLMLRVYEETPEAPEPEASDPRSQLRHAAVSVTLHLAGAHSHEDRDDRRCLEESLADLGQLVELVDTCRSRGLLSPGVAADLADLSSGARSAVHETIATLPEPPELA